MKKWGRVVGAFLIAWAYVGGVPQAEAEAAGEVSSVKSGTEYYGYPEQTRRKTEVNGILLVNKKNPLPAKYVPANLSSVGDKKGTSEAVNALNELMKGAKDEKGYTVRVISAYRDYVYQKQLYENYKKANGQEKADTFSARPGFSEHQTGLTFDVLAGKTTELVTGFGDTKEGIWIANNAYKYGFIVRYPKGKESITGYQYEPWHLRYIGVSHAKAMKEKNVATLEEYLNAVGKNVDTLMGAEEGMENGKRTDGKEGGVEGNDGAGDATSGATGESGGGTETGSSTGTAKEPFSPFQERKISNKNVGLDTAQQVLPGDISYTFSVQAEKAYHFMQKAMWVMCAGLVLYVSLQAAMVVVSKDGGLQYSKYGKKIGSFLFGEDAGIKTTREYLGFIVKNMILLAVMLVLVTCSYYVAIQGKIYAGVAYLLSFII